MDEFPVPVFFHEVRFFGVICTANLARIRAQLPTPSLHPVVWSPNRGIVAVAAINYRQTSIGSYGEAVVMIPCVFGHRPWPIVPLLRDPAYPGLGYYILHMPVTGVRPRNHGRVVWGYPKFVADMRFEHRQQLDRCELAEGGKTIFELQVPRAGLRVRERRPNASFSVREGKLLKTSIDQDSIFQTTLACRQHLKLGSHALADSLRALELSPLVLRNYVQYRTQLNAGVAIETGVRTPSLFEPTTDKEGVFEVHDEQGGAPSC